MPYTIQFVQLPIVGGIAGHNYIVLRDESGNFLAELNGLATDANGQRLPIGTSETDRLKVYETSSPYFYTSEAPQQTIFSGGEAEALALWARAQEAMVAINALNLPYPPYGFSILTPTINSNSVASTLLSAMGLTEPTLSTAAQPGRGNIILSASLLNAIQQNHPLGGMSSPGYVPPVNPPPPITTPSTPPAPPPNGSVTVGDPVPLPPLPGGGGGGGGGGSCVHITSFLPDGRRAGQIGVGDVLELADETSLIPLQAAVTYSRQKTQPGYRIATSSGVSLVCSASAPIPTRNGLVLAPDLLGHEVPTRRDEAGLPSVTSWEPVVTVEFVGPIEVQHVTVNDKCFWAGEHSGRFILHHNKYVPEEDAAFAAELEVDSMRAPPSPRVHGAADSLVSALAEFGVIAEVRGTSGQTFEMHKSIGLMHPQ